ncbi:hypothetical protein JCM33374_g6595 [Metschnikowia sp. JCM 33374]|nr:hypothetical protein JCM33374_g6595 [Metschnikowia sp. JCM 33374]
MLSDSEDMPRPPPVFKSKRKMAKARRRVREEIGEMENHDNTETGPAMYTRGSGQTATNGGVAGGVGGVGGVGTSETGKEPSASENLPEYVVVESTVPPLLSENKAYTTLPSPSKTFVLKESHFRDSPAEFIPLDKEYADAYGNVSDEDVGRNADNNAPVGDASDFEDVGDPALDKSRYARDLPDMYDSEVSVDTDHVPLGRMQEVAEAGAVVEELTEKLAALDVGIALQTTKSQALKETLSQLYSQRDSVVAEL